MSPRYNVFFFFFLGRRRLRGVINQGIIVYTFSNCRKSGGDRAQAVPTYLSAQDSVPTLFPGTELDANDRDMEIKYPF